ncbi:hypothetical protein K438DRAFT_1788777 [Mycena galopus ATCC 62051]|nr:hypothetical protein K438DRAFT_1788777 [Mycena galopus ATCC 62051]
MSEGEHPSGADRRQALNEVQSPARNVSRDCKKTVRNVGPRPGSLKGLHMAEPVDAHMGNVGALKPALGCNGNVPAVLHRRAIIVNLDEEHVRNITSAVTVTTVTQLTAEEGRVMRPSLAELSRVSFSLFVSTVGSSHAEQRLSIGIVYPSPGPAQALRRAWLGLGLSGPGLAGFGLEAKPSVIRTHVLRSVAKGQNSGITCFRVILDGENLRDIPELEWVYTGISGTRMIVKEEPFRFLFAYPRLGSLLNIRQTTLARHSIDKHRRILNISSTAWTPTATREEFIAKFCDFDPKFLRVLDLPMHSPIYRWTLRVMPLLSNWVRGRAALLGDAVHATTPMLGQGAGMAIEEAVALGCLLPAGTRREDIPARLEAYQNLRKQRGDRVNTESVAQVSTSFHYLRSEELQRFLMEYDAVKAAEECYQEVFGGGISDDA